jgi:putative serine protease PepD
VPSISRYLAFACLILFGSVCSVVFVLSSARLPTVCPANGSIQTASNASEQAMVQPVSATIPLEEEVITAIARKAMSSVVQVKTIKKGNWGKKEVTSSGVIVNRDGFVLTAYHAIAGSERTMIVRNDGSELAARIVIQDARRDLAVLRVAANESWTPVRLSASKPAIGELVVTIGHPHGYTDSVSSGIVSGLDRSITLPSGVTLTGLIQTTVPLNPGNSGGPLLNSRGEMIGLTLAIREGAQGIAFAANLETIKAVLAQVE